MSKKPTSPETLYGTGRDYLREQIKTNEILADIAGVEYTPPEGVPKGKYMENKWLLDAAEKKNELLEEIAEGGPGGGSAAAKAIGIDYATDGIFLKNKDGDTIQGSGATLPTPGLTFDPSTGGLTLTKNGTAVQGQTVTIPNYGSPVGVDASADMTDHDKIYLYLGTTGGGLTNGHFYYWDGAAWADGGEYAAATVQTDKTLLVEDRAADAKATGDAVNSLKTQITDVTEKSKNIIAGRVLGMTLGSDGRVISTVENFDVIYAEVTQGEKYKFSSNVTDYLVYAFYTSVPVQYTYPYNNTRYVEQNLDPVTAPIDGYIGIRVVKSAVANDQIEEGETASTYRPPYNDGAVDELTRYEIDVLEKYVTPEMYGAKGDGLTDDSKPLELALKSGYIVSGTGTYLVNTQIAITNKNKVHLKNVSIKSTNCNNPLYFENIETLIIDNITIDDVNGTSIARALFIKNIENFFAYNSKFTNVISESVSTGLEMNNATNFSIINCEFVNIKPAEDADGIKIFAGTKNGLISGCYFKDCDKRGIKSQSGRLLITNCYFEGNYANFIIDAQYGGTTIENCYLETDGRAGIGLGPLCAVRKCELKSNNANGFYDCFLVNAYNNAENDVIIEDCVINGVVNRFLLDADNCTLRTVAFKRCYMQESYNFMRATKITNFVWEHNTHRVETKYQESAEVTNLYFDEPNVLFSDFDHLYGRYGGTEYFTSNGVENHFYITDEPDNSSYTELTRAKLGDLATVNGTGQTFIKLTDGWTSLT